MTFALYGFAIQKLDGLQTVLLPAFENLLSSTRTITRSDFETPKGEHHMQKPLLLIAAIAALGLIYVVVPVMLDAFMRYRKSRSVDCPEAKHPATVQIDAKAAAKAAALDKAELRITQCSLWPERSACRRHCLAQVA
jgi:hypothetical protein